MTEANLPTFGASLDATIALCQVIDFVFTAHVILRLELARHIIKTPVTVIAAALITGHSDLASSSAFIANDTRQVLHN